MTFSFSWLLESEDPGVRYLALRDLPGRPAGDPELLAAQRAAHTHGAIAAILENMHPQGYWVKPNPGYTPKYFSTDWSLILLAQLGASTSMDMRISRACAYLLDHAMTSQGQFTHTGAASGTIDCLQGNLCAALVALGCDDPRLVQAYEWMARSVTGEGLAPVSQPEAPLRYYAAKCGPNFACGYNGGKPCAWGATKVMLALARWPVSRRTPLIERAIQQSLDLLFSRDPARADYPTRNAGAPSPNWRKFGFPVFYITDSLQVVEALVALGHGGDARLENAIQLIREKQAAQSGWALEYDYTGKTWVDFGPKNAPNPWVSLRALKVLKEIGQ
ncbi:MAG: hypothetical protein WCE68_05455 [Anaerolineales bacterium]